jgi:hypothetical protein
MQIQLGRSIRSENGELSVYLDGLVNENEFGEIEGAVTKLQELHNLRHLLLFVLWNESELLDYLQRQASEWCEKFKQTADLSFEDINNCMLHANRLFLNYLSAIRTYLDHSETYIKRTYGEESNEFQAFKKMAGTFFDNSFGYSFFYKLRNYAQHCGLPIGSIEFNVKNEGECTGWEFLVLFHRDSLLSKYREWGRIVKPALELKPEKFDVIALIQEETSNIREMSRNVEQILNGRFLKAATVLSGYISRIRMEKWKLFVAYDFVLDKNGKVKKYGTLDLMEETVEELIHRASIENAGQII